MASQLVARGEAACPRKPGSGHADTISITVYMPDQVERHETLDPWRSNAVDPRFHGVGSRPILMINVN